MKLTINYSSYYDYSNLVTILKRKQQWNSISVLTKFEELNIFIEMLKEPE